MIFYDIKKLIVENFGLDVILEEDISGKQPSLTLKSDQLVPVCSFLRDHELTYFDFLSSVSGIDYGIEKQLFGVVYHLYSIPFNHHLVLKVNLSNNRNEEELPEVDSISGVWKAAEWHEREVFDLLGIYFNHHPDLRRILLPDDWHGYPLRKDYKTTELYNNIKIDF